MDFGNDTFDLKRLNNKKRNMENVTPHKIAVVAFIREFGFLVNEGKDIIDFFIAANYRKDFCILALKLIQCPDMEFKELETLLTNGKYNLLSTHLQKFCVRLQYIYVNGIGALRDCVTSTEKLMIDQSGSNPCVISRTSVLGLYLRRIMIYLDKLTFAQLTSLNKSFGIYYEKGRPGLIMRSLSKEKLNSVDQGLLTTTSPPSVPDVSKHEHSIKMAIFDRENNFEEHQWSLKQAELFTAQQANLLQNNEQLALAPKQMQKIIMQIITDIPEYADIHFLSFMNCLRMKEFCGAQDSLYNCFDRSIFAQSAALLTLDRNKSFRYAALNRAAMHAQFGHNDVAMEGVREALVMAQEAGDGSCLAHVVGWAARAGGRARRALLARTPRAPRTAAAAAAAAQFLAQHVAVNGAKPAEVFTLLTKGEAINYLHSMTDLTLASLANTAALWSLYGKTEMASVNCQLLLNLNTKWSGGWSCGGWGGAGGAAVAGVVGVATWRGEVGVATLIAANYDAPAVVQVAHAARATLALHAGRWEDADQSIKQLASFDRWESQLLKAEMYYLKGEPIESLDTLQDILVYCKTEDDSLHYVSLKLRAMILMSQVKHTFCGINATNSSNIMLLNEALSLAKKYHLHYLGATVEMHIANVQLHMGCVRNALSIVKRVLPTIMAHGGAYDMARAMLLYCKCRAAAAPRSGSARTQTLASCCDTLEAVKKNLTKIDSQSRLLEVWYLQAQLYNEIGNYAARNQCAWMYRQLEAQNNIEPTSMFVMSY